jgi:hypothetical protein
MIDHIIDNGSGLLQILRQFTQPFIKILDSADISRKWIVLSKEPIDPSSDISVYVDGMLQKNKSWTGVTNPSYEMDTIDPLKLVFGNISAVQDVNDSHTGLEDGPDSSFIGMELMVFVLTKEDLDVLKIGYEAQSSVGYNLTSNELLIDVWLKIPGGIESNPTSCTIVLKDEDETIVYTSVDNIDLNGTFRFSSTTPLANDKIFTLEIVIVSNSQTYTSRIPLGNTGSFSMEDSSSISALQSNMLSQFMDVRGLLGENVDRIGSLSNGKITELELHQYTDNTFGIIRKKWKDSIVSQDGQGVNSTTRREEI